MKVVVLTIVIFFKFVYLSFSQVAVIAHISVPVDTISKSELVDLYTKDIKFWSDKIPVVIFDLKPKTDVKKSFYDFIGKSSSRMKSIWMKKKLSGEGDPPKSYLTEEDILKNIVSTPGSIGYISSDKVTNNIKVLAILPLINNFPDKN